MAEVVRKPGDVSGKTPVQSSVSTEQAVRASFGSKVHIQTTNPHAPALEGLLYTACALTNLLVITTGSQRSQSSPLYHVIPLKALTSFTILSLAPEPQQLMIPTSVDTSALRARADAAVTKAKDQAAKLNRNVERATQDLFDSLDKQFRARWKDKDIIVMERVVVKSPGYRSEDCKVITPDGEGLLGRVRKVLENERKRAAQREGGKAVTPAVPNIMPAVPAPQGVRKGG